MLQNNKIHYIIYALFIIALMIIAISVARADGLQMGYRSDAVEAPDGWEDFAYSPAIPLRESLQCIIWTTCKEKKVPFEMVLAIIETESGFQENADSGAAHGLMQLHKAYYPADMPPGENVVAGVTLLADHFARYGNWPAAVTAYAVGHDNGTRAYWQIIEYRAELWREKLQQ